MTILHYSGSSWDGTGVHAAIRQVAPRLRGRSILGVGPAFTPARQPPLKIWRGPAVDPDAINPPNLVRAFWVAWRVRRWLARGAQRVFHGHTRAGLLVALWLYLLGARRVAVTVHVYGSQRWFYRWARQILGSRLVWLTPAMKRHYGVGEGWEGCIPNGVANEVFLPFRPGPRASRLRVGGAGMLVPWKRWDLVLQALAQPGAEEVEFLHAGGAVDSAGSRRHAAGLQTLALELGVAGRVQWLGWQESSAALLGAVDLVLVPSDGEPFSMIALEALAAGVPVLATRGGGPEDFIQPGRNGWLVPAGDAAALGAALAHCRTGAAWAHLRQDESFTRQFSVPTTLARRWEAFYGAL